MDSEAQGGQDEISIFSFPSPSVECCSKRLNALRVYDTSYKYRIFSMGMVINHSPRRKEMPLFHRVNVEGLKKELEEFKEISRISTAPVPTWRNKRKKTKKTSYMENGAYCELRPFVERHTQTGRGSEINLLLSCKHLTMATIGKPNWVSKNKRACW